MVCGLGSLSGPGWTPILVPGSWQAQLSSRGAQLGGEAAGEPQGPKVELGSISVHRTAMFGRKYRQSSALQDLGSGEQAGK